MKAEPKYKIGDKITLRDTSYGILNEYKIMAYADGYYMLRYPRAMPFVMSEKHIDIGMKYV
uniref:Uncharacterized protein n=1 Tax=viral metagenome TaxID=1070528 RepID=A0A6H1ZCG6_9ZZZZ